MFQINNKTVPWETEGKFNSMLSNGLRLGLWNKSIIKFAFIKSRVFSKVNPRTGRLRRHITCDYCGDDRFEDKIEVDHIMSLPSCTKETITEYVLAMVVVTFDDLQMLCKDKCHLIKNHSDLTGMSMELAALDKQAIAMTKPAKKARATCLRLSIPYTNAKQARVDVFEYLQTKDFKQ